MNKLKKYANIKKSENLTAIAQSLEPLLYPYLKEVFSILSQVREGPGPNSVCERRLGPQPHLQFKGRLRSEQVPML